MKLVSVIIPVYQVDKYIAKAVQSVLNQTYANFELLIIDDGSPDRSIEICQQFTDPRITIISQPNRGLAGARNTGIRHAQGDYLAFLDGDDLWEPKKLAQHIEHLHAPQVGVSFSRSALIDESGDRLGTYLMPQLQNITVPCLMRGSPIGNGSAAVIRRAVFDEIKFADNLYGTTEDFYFDEQFRRSEDIECWLRIAILTAWQIEGIPEALTLYRVNTQGLSANFLKQLESWEKVLDKLRAIAPAEIAPWEDMAMAYALRYLARSAIRIKSAEAVNLINRALFTYWRILVEEPRRTGLTLVAAYLLRWTPKSLYGWVERFGNKLTGTAQKQQIQQDGQVQQSST